MSALSSEVNAEFFKKLEEAARSALVSGNYTRNSLINPATVLMLLTELERSRTSAKAAALEGEYQQGYRDGWVDARLSPPADCKPVAWAIVRKGEHLVKVYAEPPKDVPADAQCRALYMQPQTSLSSSSAK
ncbi:MAG TPA: hypothetical protein VFV43_01670 [Limnobacter sp.]|nr:hypothetical protein [Limnobacter sp.]